MNDKLPDNVVPFRRREEVTVDVETSFLGAILNGVAILDAAFGILDPLREELKELTPNERKELNECVKSAFDLDKEKNKHE